MKKFYVYKVTFIDNTYYIGYRGSVQPAETDFLIKYFTSSNTVKCKLQIVEHTGQILAQELTKEVAYNLEQSLIFDSIKDPYCLNKVCYFGREGFGLLTESAIAKVSAASIERWKDPVFKEKMSTIHKSRWEQNPELKERQSNRLTGRKRPEHSAKLTGRKNPKASVSLKGKPKPAGHGENVSKAIKGILKTEAHKKKLSGPKPRVCRLTDRKEMSVNHYTRWIISQGLENG